MGHRQNLWTSLRHWPNLRLCSCSTARSGRILKLGHAVSGLRLHSPHSIFFVHSGHGGGNAGQRLGRSFLLKQNQPSLNRRRRFGLASIHVATWRKSTIPTWSRVNAAAEPISASVEQTKRPSISCGPLRISRRRYTTIPRRHALPTWMKELWNCSCSDAIPFLTQKPAPRRPVTAFRHGWLHFWQSF